MSARVLAFFDLLDGSDVRDRIRQMIVDMGTVSEQDMDALCNSVDQRLRSMRASLHDVCYEDDMSEAEGMLPWIWLEMRFEWMRYNAQMQYQTVMLGTANPELMARGAALSSLIEGVERQLDATQLYTVMRIAADPAGVALAAVARTERLFSVMANASLGGREAVESLLTAQEKMARLNKAGPVRQEMTDAIGTVMQKVGDALRVTSEDFNLALQGVMLAELGQAPMLSVLVDANNHAECLLSSEVAIGLLRAAREWMAAMRDTSMMMHADERISLGRPSFVTIAWTIRNTPDQVILELVDDADGTVHFMPATAEWPIQDLRFEARHEPGHGSTVTIHCDVSSLAEYLMLRVGAEEHDALVCVPSLLVLNIEQRDRSALAVRGTHLINRLHGGAHPLIDLGDELFDMPIDASEATYVHVRSGDDAGEILAMRVRGVQGICRGSMKSVPKALQTPLVRGFIVTADNMVAVLDITQTVQLAQRQREVADLVVDELVEIGG